MEYESNALEKPQQDIDETGREDGETQNEGSQESEEREMGGGIVWRRISGCRLYGLVAIKNILPKMYYLVYLNTDIKVTT